MSSNLINGIPIAGQPEKYAKGRSLLAYLADNVKTLSTRVTILEGGGGGGGGGLNEAFSYCSWYADISGSIIAGTNINVSIESTPTPVDISGTIITDLSGANPSYIQDLNRGVITSVVSQTPYDTITLPITQDGKRLIWNPTSFTTDNFMPTAGVDIVFRIYNNNPIDGDNINIHFNSGAAVYDNSEEPDGGYTLSFTGCAPYAPPDDRDPTFATSVAPQALITCRLSNPIIPTNAPSGSAPSWYFY